MAVERRHPPKLIFRGDWELGQEYVRPGKSEMIRTASQADKMHAPQYARTTLLDKTKGVYVITKVNGPFQQIEIVAPTIPKEGKEIPEVPDLVIPDQEDQIYVGIYSGFSYSYDIQWEFTDGPPPLPLDWRYRLHEFNPTEPCREAYPKDFDPGLDYQPITRLVMESDPDIRNYGGSSTYREGFKPSTTIPGDIEQCNVVHPCQYTGPLARACSLALGNGNFNVFSADDRESLLDEHAHDWFRTEVRNTGFKIGYDFHYDRTHGAMQDNKGNWWLIEIAQYHGIIARRMPMIKYSFYPKDKEEQKAVNEFGGIPSGEGFPNSTFEIDNQIALGNFIRLMDTDDYQTDFMDDQIFYSQACSWCFNDTGDEARVTTYNYEHPTANWMQNAYWKLEFSIFTDNAGNSSGTADLTLIREDIMADGRELRLNGTSQSSIYSHFPIYHYHPEDNATYQFNLPSQPYTNDWDDIPDPQSPGEVAMDFPIWVGWIEGDWHEINFRMCKIVEYQKSTTRSDLWPASEAGVGKPAITHTGRMPVTAGSQSQWDDPAWVIVSSYSPAFDEGEPTVHSGMTGNGTFIDINETEAEWTGITTHGYIGDNRVTDIYKIYQVRNIFFHTETWNFPTHLVDFVMVPYNRNAYYIRRYDERDGKKEQHAIERFVFMYQNTYGARHNDGDTLYNTGQQPPPWDSWDPGIEYNYTPGDGAVGAFLLAYNDLQSADTAPDSCDTPDDPPPPKWYISRASAYQQGGVAAQLGPAENNFPAYGSYSQGWHPTPVCGPIPDPSQEQGYRDDLWPRQGTGARKDGVHYVSQPVEKTDWWLVVDRSPVPTSDAPFFVGSVDHDDDYITQPTTGNLFLLQSAVVGKKGFIYSDVSKMIYDVPSGWPWFYSPIHYEGLMPEVKEAGFENYERRWLTFVGVNNE